VSGRHGTFAVDRLEGRLATLVSGDGAVADVPLRWLPSGLREGAILRVAIGSVGPDWTTAVADDAASRWRDALLCVILEQLRLRNLGGRLDSCIASGFNDLP
jgi:hypothetical protein